MRLPMYHQNKIQKAKNILPKELKPHSQAKNEEKLTRDAVREEIWKKKKKGKKEESAK